MTKTKHYAIIVMMSQRIIVTKRGGYRYYAVRCPLRYERMAYCGGYVLEHRLLMAIYMGRCLYRNERVLHLDGNTMNNEISNLRIIVRKCGRIKCE